MYRKFQLLNGAGQTIELTSKQSSIFADSPQGLGYSRTLSTLRLGDESKITYSLFNLDQMAFDLLFIDEKTSSKYQKYNDLIRFLAFKPLYLKYNTPNTFKWYRRQVEVLSLTKTQVSQDGALHCQMQLSTLSFWEDDEINVIETSSQSSASGKTYPITYSVEYGETSLTNINIVSQGLITNPLIIEIHGRSVNPRWVLYDENNNIYGEARLEGTFDDIYINSDEANETMLLSYNGALLDNPLSYQDLTVGSPSEKTITFLKLKPGTSKLAFIMDQAFEGSVRVEWRNRYVTV